MTMNPVPPASLPALFEREHNQHLRTTADPPTKFERAFVPLASPPAPDVRNSNQTLRTPTDSTCKFAPPYSGVLRKPQPTPQSPPIPKT
jgi:hypothetical protein